MFAGCCLLGVVSGGCFSTRTVTAAHLGSLRAPAEGDELVLPHDSGVPVRLSPTARVRFRRIDGTTTGWLPARRLRVDREMVWGSASGDPAKVDGIRWETLAELEVNDLDFARSVAGTAGGAALVMGAALVEVIAIGLVAGITGGLVQVDEIGITRAALGEVTAHIGRRPDADESFAWERPPPDPAAAVARARPLFAPSAKRRALVQVVGTVGSGVRLESTRALVPVATFAAGVRLLNVIEVGGGLRLMGDAPASVAEPAVGAGQRWTAAPFLRLGLHVDVDAARRVAVFAGIEGSTRGPAQLGLTCGVRWRPGGGALQLGLYPMNPLYGWEASAQRRPPHRSLATTLELAFLL